MTKFYQVLTKQGNVCDIKAIDKIGEACGKLFDGTYLVSFMRLRPQSEIKEYRACYFAKIDAIANDVGDTRYGIHELVKQELITNMVDEAPDLFTDEEVSTKYLTPEGWIALLERLDLWAFTNYNIVLQ